MGNRLKVPERRCRESITEVQNLFELLKAEG